MYWQDKEEGLVEKYYTDQTTKNLRKIEQKLLTLIRNVLYKYYTGQFNLNDTDMIVNDVFTTIIVDLCKKNVNRKSSWFSYLSMKAKHIIYTIVIAKYDNLLGKNNDISMEDRLEINDPDTHFEAIYEENNIDELDDLKTERFLIKMIKRKKEIGHIIKKYEKDIYDILHNELTFNSGNKRRAAYKVRRLTTIMKYNDIIDTVLSYLKKYGWSGMTQLQISEYFKFNVKYSYQIINKAVGFNLIYNISNELSVVDADDLTNNMLDDYIVSEEAKKNYTKQEKINKNRENPYFVKI